jgi:Ser/Thr protein kinase RdoA (MazF antagonist)
MSAHATHFGPPLAKSLRTNPERLAAHLSSLKIEAVTISEFEYGIASQNFYVRCRNGREFVARCDARRTVDEIKEDCRFSRLARRHAGIMVPNGPWSFSVMDKTSVALRPHLDGLPLPDLDPLQWPDGEQLGFTLSKLHRIDAPPTARVFFYMPFLSSLIGRWPQLRKYLACLADDAGVTVLIEDALWKAEPLSRCHQMLFESPMKLIHGDYTPSNFLLTERALVLIDWEKSCRGPVCADLVQAIYYFGAANPPEATRFASAFLSGYGELPTGLQAWWRYLPAVIFLFDACSAAANRRADPAFFSKKREQYFLETSLPRYLHFLETHAAKSLKGVI